MKQELNCRVTGV